jgi:hypothetical protein
LRLREDVLKRRDIDHNPPIGAESLYASSSVLSAPSMLPSVPAAVAALTYDQRAGSGTGLGMHSTSSRYGYDSYSVWYVFVFKHLTGFFYSLWSSTFLLKSMLGWNAYELWLLSITIFGLVCC